MVAVRWLASRVVEENSREARCAWFGRSRVSATVANGLALVGLIYPDQQADPLPLG